MDQFEEFESKSATCTVCEAMLPEAVDGTLTDAEQRAFDKHVAGCVECARELAEARRGAAWLGMLKSQSPEPPASLLARILAETTGAQSAAAPAFVPVAAEPEAPYDWTPRPVVVPSFGARLSQRWNALFSLNGATSNFQPRMAMTAAMAFFSIALTLNLTGVRLSDLRAENFTPSALQRAVSNESASVTRSFQNNRMVYQMESKVSELREDDAPQTSNEGRPSR
jgi:anti-sigma factor RsiW